MRSYNEQISKDLQDHWNRQRARQVPVMLIMPRLPRRSFWSRLRIKITIAFLRLKSWIRRHLSRPIGGTP